MPDYITTDKSDSSVTVTLDAGKLLDDGAQYAEYFGHVSPPPGFPSAQDVYRKAIEKLKNTLPNGGKVSVTIPFPPAIGSEAPALPDPAQVLEQLVGAINSAESTLNKQNFVIASGSVDAKLSLGPAEVQVNFSITPKPYS